MTSDCVAGAKERFIERVAHYAGYSMHFSSLVIESTNRCNAQCGMCYQSAGPKGTDSRGILRLELDVIERVIDQAITIKALEPRFHLAGGEAFLRAGDCVRLITRAKAAGYMSITATTNAYWATSPDRAFSLATQLANAGLTSVEISWDHWHQPFISHLVVEEAIHAFFFVGVPVNLRILGTKSHSYDECLRHFSAKALGRVSQITGGPVFPTGRAERAVPRGDIFETDPSLLGTCHDALNLTVVASGDVYPCCAGLDQTDHIRFGNVKEQSIVEIYQRLSTDPLARVLVFGGPKFLLNLLDSHFHDLAEAQYANICHACWSLFSRNDAVVKLRSLCEDDRLISLWEVLKDAARAISIDQGPASDK